MRAESFRTPVTLSGRYVELVPLSLAHGAELWEPASHPAVGQFLRTGQIRSARDMQSQIAALLTAQSAGTDLPFTIRLRPLSRAIGMTRFLRIDRPDQSVEIGGTWLATTYWRTPVNTESKLLMLTHAFDTEGAHRVQLQTDLRNERSQRAIARLGAVREGVLREDVLLPDGYRRSSVYYSILASEWPAVKTRLEAALARPWTPPTSRGPA